jgi:quercetin dioxygenase-like cupin family protein
MTVAAQFPGVALHVHHHEDEALYVLAGELTARVGDRTHTLGAGAFILMPRDVPHSFANPNASEARVLVISSPGAVERYFEETAELAKAAGGQLDMQQQVELAKRYGIEFLL